MKHKLRIAETVTCNGYQISFLDLASAPKNKPRPRLQPAAQARKVSDIQSQLRRLHDELNVVLYTAPAKEKPCIHSPQDAADLLFPFLSNLDHEELWVIDLNVRNQVQCLVKVYQGSANSAQVRVGELFQTAIAEKHHALIIAHNHPSGVPGPSPEDVALTRAIIQAGSLLDIQVLDHLVIAGAQFVSLKERGLGFN